MMRMLFDGGEDGVMPVGPAMDAVPLRDAVSHWCSRMLGYLALAAACGGVLKIFF